MSELALIENINAVEVFKTGGVQPLIDRVREEVTGEVPDLTTDKGRKRIASLAHKVAKSKTALDKAGKELADQLNAQLKPINAERKIARDELDKLRDEVRKPLTDWEDAENLRIDNHKKSIQIIRDLSLSKDDSGEPLYAYQLESMLSSVESIKLGEHWEEFEAEAARVKEQTLSDLKINIAARQKYEDEQAELERLRQEKAAQEQKDREDQIAREAEAKARRDAEAEAKRIAEEQAEKDRQAAQRQADLKREAEEAEQRRIAQENQARIDAENAETLRIQQAKQAEENAKIAEQKRLDDIEFAKQQEIARQAAEQNRIAEEQRQKAANKEHTRLINKNIVQALLETGITEAQAQHVVTMIIKNQIPNTSIKY